MMGGTRSTSRYPVVLALYSILLYSTLLDSTRLTHGKVAHEARRVGRTIPRIP